MPSLIRLVDHVSPRSIELACLAGHDIPRSIELTCLVLSG